MGKWIRNRSYSWIAKNGGYQVGKVLLVDGSIVWNTQIDSVLMQPSHAGAPVWVRADDLHDYPSETIEEPSVKGGEQ